MEGWKKGEVKEVDEDGTYENFVKRLYRRPDSLVAPADRRFLVIKLLFFFGVKRFSDSQDQSVGWIGAVEAAAEAGLL